MQISLICTSRIDAATQLDLRHIGGSRVLIIRIYGYVP
jgi:hypothetical protein